MNSIIAIVGAIIAILLGLFGIEKHKNKKLGEKLEKQESKIVVLEKQKEVYKANETVSKETNEKLQEISDEQKKEEDTIEQAESIEEVIDIANDIIAGFNRVPDKSSSK